MSIKFSYDATGIFREEIKNRFRAIVEINSVNKICYIQSSSRLSNYVELLDNEVKLLHNSSIHLDYTVLAKKKKHDYMLLCPKMANDIVYSELNRRIFSFLGYRQDAIREHYVDGYKSDIYLKKRKTVIEIKAHIAETSDSLFPTVYSERTIHQLDLFDKMLNLGYKIVFIICSFNPYTNSIILDNRTIFYRNITNLVGRGLIIKGYSITCKNGIIRIKKEIPIIF